MLELKPRKRLADIAAEVGFVSPNYLSMLRVGQSPLPLDRVFGLAKALEVDARDLLVLALEQHAGSTARAEIERIVGTVVSSNEVAIIGAIRDASDHSDPPLTVRLRAGLVALFGRAPKP